MKNKYFEWDDAKALANLAKHGVSFEEAILALGDFDGYTYLDARHSEEEDRFIIVCMSPYWRLLTVAYTMRDEEIVRIISARPATARERQSYEEKNRNRI